MTVNVKYIDQAHECDSIDGLIRLYSDWADTYDQELKDWSYVAPEKTVEVFKKHVADTTTKILDVGCGTGLVGSLLQDGGYSCIDGLDLSSRMLTKAEETCAYENLFLRDIMEAATLPKKQYQAVISVGIFSKKHAGPSGLNNIIRLLSKDGIACITITADTYREEGYQAKLAQLVEQGDCSIIEESQEAYIIGQNVHSRILVLRKN